MTQPRLFILGFAACALAAPLLSGCEVAAIAIGATAADDDEDYYDDYSDYQTMALQVRDAKLSGSLGDVQSFQSFASDTTAYSDSSGTYITVWVRNDSPHWVVMSNLSFDADLSSPIFDPGAVLDSTDPRVRVSMTNLGCSGTGVDADTLPYENNPVETTVEVTASTYSGMVHLKVESRYTNLDTGLPETMTTELDVVRPEAS
ncbi:MAG: hypothetical protein U0271_12050 [Polyangiaceae bacterium]